MDVILHNILDINITFVIWITQGIQGIREQNVTGNIVPLVLPTQMDSDSSEEEHEDDTEEQAINECEAASTEYITRGVCDYDSMTYIKEKTSDGTNKAGQKGIMVRFNILMLCVKMCSLYDVDVNTTLLYM